MLIHSEKMSVTDVFNHCINVNIIKSSSFVHYVLLFSFLMLMNFIMVCTRKRLKTNVGMQQRQNVVSSRAFFGRIFSY